MYNGPFPPSSSTRHHHRPTTRRLPWWAIVLMVVIGLATVAGGTVAAIALGIASFGHHAQFVDDAPARDKALQAADPAGGTACNYLDMSIGGIGSYEQAAEQAAGASTEAIRTATTARQMYDACVAAGANMSPWPAR
jgi:hypothetical protein